jgi:NADPH:quinone reductase-like Zn-dependent oxidoreductase
LSVAYSLLVEAAELKSGQRILIHGAAGSVGAIVVQMASALGAHVIGTATGNGIKSIKSMGADEVIDYRLNDFTDLSQDVDLIINLVGGDTLDRSYSLIRRGGKLLSLVAFPSQEEAKSHNISASFINDEVIEQDIQYDNIVFS